MVTLSTAESALKDVYLGVISNALNVNTNPLLSKIKQSSNDVWGKQIIKLAPYGINGGIGAGSESGSLPSAGGNNYVQFKSDLKNLYGTIEISDKAIRASQNNAGAFVNLLNAEMEGLITASMFNFGRMLYGDGSGLITVASAGSTTTITVTSVKGLMEGMIVEFTSSDGSSVYSNTVRKITSINRTSNTITIDSALPNTVSYPCCICVQNSLDKEITGLNKIFSSSGSLYGLDRSTYTWLVPYMDSTAGTITDARIQTALDTLEEDTGSIVDFISCASNVKRYYQSYLSTYRRNIDYMELQGGFKAMSYAGIPIVSDKFVQNGCMYLLNTKEFTLHQLCDWQWLEGEDGRIIKQKNGYPVYYATLVKYADLICDKPNGQAKFSEIVEETSTDDSSSTGDSGTTGETGDSGTTGGEETTPSGE